MRISPQRSAHFLYFFSDYFAVSKLCYTFVAVKQLAMTYQVNEVLQRISQFFATFCTLSLVNPNNLLTHTHTLAPSVAKTFFLLAYARAKRAMTPINKGLFGVSFVRFFIPFCKLDLEQNKNEVTIILINKQDALTTYPLKKK